MPRTDNDSWAITESVGATALGVAAARAAETESDNPLINDPFARIFVDAAGDGIWSMYTNRTLLAGATDLDPDLRAPIQQMIDFMAARTAFFDEYFLATADAGVRQVVILASGLDSRAWRLPWPDGTVVYELDQPKVLEFKSATLRQHGAQPASQLVNVPIDLRQDWPKDLLFERIDALSRPGSWLASNVPGAGFLDPERMRRQRADMRRMRAAAAKLVETEISDVDDLWYAEQRTAVAEWLRERGWDVSTATLPELLARYGRSIPHSGEDSIPPNLFVSAQRATS